MTKGVHWTMLKISLGLCAALAGTANSPAWAETVGASAQGAVVIVKPVGTGVAFDTLTSALSGAFLHGQPGDAVSLLLPERGAGRVPVEVLVLSTSFLNLGTGAPPAGTGLASGPRTASLDATGGGGGSLLFLAQFN